MVVLCYFYVVVGVLMAVFVFCCSVLLPSDSFCVSLWSFF